MEATVVQIVDGREQRVEVDEVGSMAGTLRATRLDDDASDDIDAASTATADVVVDDVAFEPSAGTSDPHGDAESGPASAARRDEWFPRNGDLRSSSASEYVTSKRITVIAPHWRVVTSAKGADLKISVCGAKYEGASLRALRIRGALAGTGFARIEVEFDPAEVSRLGMGTMEVLLQSRDEKTAGLDRIGVCVRSADGKLIDDTIHIATAVALMREWSVFRAQIPKRRLADAVVKWQSSDEPGIYFALYMLARAQAVDLSVARVAFGLGPEKPLDEQMADMLDAEDHGGVEKLLHSVAIDPMSVGSIRDLRQRYRLWKYRHTIDRPMATYRHLNLLAEAGGMFDREFKRAPGRYLSKMIIAAINSEMLESAVSMTVYALAKLPGLSLKDRAQAMPGIVEGLVLKGDPDLAVNYIRQYPGCIEGHEPLFALYSDRAFGPSVDPMLAMTPKGKLNTYYIANRIEDADVYLSRVVATEADQFRRNPQNVLILANLAAYKRDHELYVHYVNVFLENYQLDRIVPNSDVLAEPTLANIDFESVRRVEDDHELVTVLMAVRNGSLTLEYSVRSILRQSYVNFELLICDDASDDDTWAMLQRISREDARIRIFQSSAPQGPYNLRNAMLAAAHGEYITFQDADDVSLPSRLSRQVGQLRTDPLLVAVGGRWIRVAPDGRFIYFRDNFCLRQSTVSVMYRREVFDDLGGFDRVRFGADSEFLERICAREGPKSVLIMPIPLLFGLWSESSMTRRAGSEVDEEGYRSPARRAYAEARMRERLAGLWSGRDEQYPNYMAPAAVEAADAAAVSI